MYNLQTRIVQFKDQKTLKTYLIVRTELTVNENKLNSRKYKTYMLKPLDMSEICFVVQRQLTHTIY